MHGVDAEKGKVHSDFLLYEFTVKVVGEHMTCTVNPRAKTSAVDKERTDYIVEVS